jgi:hypothetical protein
MLHLIAIIILIVSGILLVLNGLKKQKRRTNQSVDHERLAEMYGCAFLRFSCTVDQIILSMTADSSIEKVLERIEFAHAKESQELVQYNGKFFSDHLLRVKLRRAANRFSMLKGG